MARIEKAGPGEGPIVGPKTGGRKRKRAEEEPGKAAVQDRKEGSTNKRSKADDCDDEKDPEDAEDA